MSRTLKCNTHRKSDLAQLLSDAWRRARRHGDRPDLVADLSERTEDLFDTNMADQILARAISLCPPHDAFNLARWVSDGAMGLSIIVDGDEDTPPIRGHVQLFAIPVFGADHDIYRAFRDGTGAQALCRSLRATGMIADSTNATICSALTYPLDAAIALTPGQLRDLCERMAAILITPDDCAQEQADFVSVALESGAEIVPRDPNPSQVTIINRILIGARLQFEPDEESDGPDDYFSTGMTESDEFVDNLTRWVSLVNGTSDALQGVNVGAPATLMDSLVDANIQFLNGSLSIEAAKHNLSLARRQHAVASFQEGPEASEVTLVVDDITLGPITIPNSLIALDSEAFVAELQRLGSFGISPEGDPPSSSAIH